MSRILASGGGLFAGRVRSWLVLSWAIAVASVLALSLLLHHAAERDALPLGHTGITLLAPSWLRLLAFAPLFFPALGSSLADLSRGQRGLSLLMRVLCVAGLALSLCRPTRSGGQRTACAVALVDVSDSISDGQLDEARASVEELRAARGGNLLSLVAFATRPHLVPLPPDGAPLLAIPRPAAWGAREGGADSDLQAALRMVDGLCPDGSTARVLLLSDGNQTRGDVLAEAKAARARGLFVSVHPLSRSGDDEVLVRAVTLPPSVKRGEPFFVDAEIEASRAVRATLVLRRNGRESGPFGESNSDGQRTVELAAGSNHVRFRSRVDEPGVALFEVSTAELVSGGAPFHDRMANNNRATTAVLVGGRPRILFVEGDPLAETPLAQVLERAQLDVSVMTPGAVPASLEGLASYDLVVLSDVAAAALGDARMNALERFVRVEGGGLLFAAGQNVYGSGGYDGTAVEKLLPVRFEVERSAKRPRLALVLAIDRSGSMQGQKLELAKDAARATAAVLDPDDLLGIIAFDALAQPIVKLARIGQVSQVVSPTLAPTPGAAAAATAGGRSAQPLANLDQLVAGGGTDILPALKEAHAELASAPASVRHLIVLTDGRASYEGIPELCEQMAREHITVSAVGVGSGADRTLLSLIAERGGGRFYAADDPEDVPQIFIRDTSEVARPSLIETPTRVRVLREARVLDGVDFAGAPPLRGVVASRLRPLAAPQAELLLATDRGEPLLGRMRVGSGQTAVWLSDVKNRWAADWVRWPGYATLFTQLARGIMRRRLSGTGDDDAAPGTSHIRTKTSGRTVRVVADAFGPEDEFLDGMETTLEVADAALDPGLRAPRRLILEQVAPGRYAGAFEIEHPGSFFLHVVHRRAGGVVSAAGRAVMTQSAARESLFLAPDEALLARAAALGGGTVRPSPAALFAPGAIGREAHPHELRAMLLLLCALMFVLDVFVRRVRLL